MYPIFSPPGSVVQIHTSGRVIVFDGLFVLLPLFKCSRTGRLGSLASRISLMLSISPLLCISSEPCHINVPFWVRILLGTLVVKRKGNGLPNIRLSEYVSIL